MRTAWEGPVFLRKAPLPLPRGATASLKTQGTNRRNRCQPVFVVVCDIHKDKNEGALRFQRLLGGSNIKKPVFISFACCAQNYISLLPASLPLCTVAVPLSISPQIQPSLCPCSSVSESWGNLFNTVPLSLHRSCSFALCILRGSERLGRFRFLFLVNFLLPVSG